MEIPKEVKEKYGVKWKVLVGRKLRGNWRTEITIEMEADTSALDVHRSYTVEALPSMAPDGSPVSYPQNIHDFCRECQEKVCNYLGFTPYLHKSSAFNEVICFTFDNFSLCKKFQLPIKIYFYVDNVEVIIDTIIEKLVKPIESFWDRKILEAYNKEPSEPYTISWDDYYRKQQSQTQEIKRIRKVKI